MREQSENRRVRVKRCERALSRPVVPRHGTDEPIFNVGCVALDRVRIYGRGMSYGCNARIRGR